MLIQNKIGNISTIDINNRLTDWLQLEWYEAGKRILRRQTMAGRDIALKFPDRNPALTEGDVLYEDDTIIIAVEILTCNVLVIQPANPFEIASICYEIGNKHLPLFFDGNDLLVPFEMPLFRLLTGQGYAIKQDHKKLLHPLKTSVAPHAHSNNSLFSKLMQLTNASE